METAFLFTDKYLSYDYGTSHPLRVERLDLTYRLCKAFGLFDLPKTRLVETRAASESEIMRFHAADYIEALKKTSAGQSSGDFAYGIGPGDNPAFPGMWEWSRLHAGASIQCAQMISAGEIVFGFNIAGGLHHAAARRASGFCYVNDPVLAIDHFVDQGKRVLYLDVDAHHGDGVQWAFFDDPRVLTVSFHQDGRTLFPGTGGVAEMGQGEGSGYAVNVPMLPGTDDHAFWTGFDALVPMLVARFNPDAVVSQLGVDTFIDDPLAALELTTNGFCRVIEYLTELGRPWVALGGGGYNPANVARAWTLAWAVMNGVDLPDELPRAMVEPLRTAGCRGDRLRDPAHESPWQEKCCRHVEKCIEYLEQKVVPKIR